MARVKFYKGKQRKFLEEIIHQSGFNESKIANICKVSDRTIRDWRREKYFMAYEALLKLCKLAGILLGDGGIRGDHQVTVSFNMKTDKEYANYIQEIIGKLFGFSSSVYPRKGTKGADIVISGKNLVEFLADKNILKKGNKIVNQIDIPKWIKENRNYKISCLRGLMDTDGGIYYHRYKVDGKWYKYPRLSFCSSSRSLTDSATNILKELNFTPKINKDKITLYRLPEIRRYFKKIGTHNPKHLERYKTFYEN